MRNLLMVVAACALLMHARVDSREEKCRKLLEEALAVGRVDVAVSQDSLGRTSAAVLLDRISPQQLPAIRALASASLGLDPDRGDRLEVVIAGRAVSPASRCRPLFAQGSLVETGNPLDVAIDGDGYFRVQRRDGSTGYTRDGSLKYNSELGALTTTKGLRVGLPMPRDMTNVEVTPDGQVKGTAMNGDGRPVVIGQFKLTRFLDPSGLRPCEDGLFEATPDCGPAVEGAPGTRGLGVLAQGHLEGPTDCFPSHPIPL